MKTLPLAIILTGFAGCNGPEECPDTGEDDCQTEDESPIPEAYRDYIAADDAGGYLVQASGLPPVDDEGTEHEVNDPVLVQWAVDHTARRVTLVDDGGEFQFGDDGSVFVYTPESEEQPRAVEIVGEWDAGAGEPATRIVGGLRVFTIGLPPAEWADDVDLDDGWMLSGEPRALAPARARIASLCFDQYRTVGIWVAATDRVVLEDNRFEDGVSQPWVGWSDTPTARAILVYTPDSMDLTPKTKTPLPRVDPDELPDTRSGTAITGTVAIRRNVVEGNSRYDETEGFQGSSHGLFAWYFDADLEVSGNEVRDYTVTGLGVGGFFRSAVVRDNVLARGEVGAMNFGVLMAEDGYLRGLFGAPISEGDAALGAGVVTGNTITTTGTDPGAAIALISRNEGAVVTDNTLSVDNPTGVAIQLLDDHADTYVGGNTIHGDAMYAGVLVSPRGQSAVDIAVHANSFTGTGTRGLSIELPYGGSATGTTLTENALATGAKDDFAATGAQVWIEGDHTLLHANHLGGGGEAAVVVSGSDNTLSANHHHGSYAGWSSKAEEGLWRLEASSADNWILRPGPDGLDTTDQLRDLGTDNLLELD